MSALLEQAIVDASALKEAALKNAESAILEKYAPEIKSAVDSLLEQEEASPLGAATAVATAAVEAIPLAAAEEAPLCPCPEEDEVVEIDFDKLQKMADELPAEEPEDSAMLATDLGMEEEGEEEEFALQEGFDITETVLKALEKATPRSPRGSGGISESGYRRSGGGGYYGYGGAGRGGTTGGVGAYDEECVDRAMSYAGMTERAAIRFCKEGGGSYDEIPSTFDEDDPTLDEDVLKEEEADCLKDYKLGSLSWREYQDCLDGFDEGMSAGEEIELTEENLDAILEELIVDIKPQKSGWAGTPSAVMDHYAELELARLASTEAQEQIKTMKQALGNIKKDYAQISESFKTVRTKNKRLAKTLSSMKDKLEEVNLSNARLFYTNRVLNSSSLNERQKSKIAEAISDSRSVNEAKVIYETLQSAVGSSSKKKGPKSLSEAVNRNSPLMARRESSSSADTSAVQRMQRLAGISKK